MTTQALSSVDAGSVHAVKTARPDSVTASPFQSLRRAETARRAALALGFVLSLGLALTASGCKSAQKADSDSAGPQQDLPAADDNVMGDSDSGRGMGLQTVYFAYDSFELDPKAREAIANNAKVLKDTKSLKVQIEGHCDQRGGVQYNIALGEKRAGAVRKILTSMGVEGARLSVISYGKERPVDPAENDAAYAKNRRANFVITAK